MSDIRDELAYTPEKVAELRKIAESVDTPGPWETRCEGYGEPWRVCHDQEYVRYLGHEHWAEFSQHDAEFLMEFNPKAVIGLLDALAAVTAERDAADTRIEMLVEHSVRVEGGPIPWIEIDAFMWDRILSRIPEHPTNTEGQAE